MKYSKKYRTEKSLYRLWNKLFRSIRKTISKDFYPNYEKMNTLDRIYENGCYRVVKETIRRREERMNQNENRR